MLRSLHLIEAESIIAKKKKKNFVARTHKSAKTHAGKAFVTPDLDLWPPR